MIQELSGRSETEITYLPEVECEVQDGLLDTQVIGVPDEKGNKQFFRLGKGAVTELEGKIYVPVGIVQLDYRARRALIELPQEADSGVRRIWVPFVRFRPQR